MDLLAKIFTTPTQRKSFTRANGIHFSKKLAESAHADGSAVLDQLNTTLNGLSRDEVEARLELYGPNEVAKEKLQTPLMRLWDNFKNPLVVLLLILAIISYLTGDVPSALIMLTMVLIGIVLRFVQESRAGSAAEKLREMVSTTATVIRSSKRIEITLRDLVPGDIVTLSAGDMIPADVRLLSAKDLFLNQSALTGESLPLEKTPVVVDGSIQNPLEMNNLLFLGSDVESGTGTAVVIQTGSETYFGSMVSEITGQRPLTSFDKGITSFTWLMIRFMTVMVPLVFLFNGISKGNWLEAFMFALAVAVGLTPEMLPAIVTINCYVAKESHRQEVERHSELRSDGCAVYRQDRHPYGRQNCVGETPGRNGSRK